MELFQIFFQFEAIHKHLVRFQEERNDLCVEIVYGREHRTEGQIVEIGQIDLVAWLNIPEQLCWQHEAEEQIDREHEDEVWQIRAEWRTPLRYPLLISREDLSKIIGGPCAI
jgi:hypothetical protein